MDDSLSTNVLPAIAAVEVFDGRPLALLAGGFDRNIDYSELARAIARRSAPTVVMTLPDNGDRIYRAVTSLGAEAVACQDLGEAVARAAAWAQPGAVVLLSPAAASYGLFRNYEQRADVFRSCVAGIANGTGP